MVHDIQLKAIGFENCNGYPQNYLCLSIKNHVLETYLEFKNNSSSRRWFLYNKDTSHRLQDIFPPPDNIVEVERLIEKLNKIL